MRCRTSMSKCCSSSNSAQLTNRAFATLAILGRALADERLGGQVFLIAGHTDATGPPDYNLALSERRAQAVRDFLIMNFGIAEDRLLARGFGPSRLKVPQHPGSRLNRRVQVVNWTSEADAKRGAAAASRPARAAAAAALVAEARAEPAAHALCARDGKLLFEVQGA